MRILIVGIVIVALFVGVIYFINQPRPQGGNTADEVDTTSRFEQIQDDVSKMGAKLYDVRTGSEYA